MTNHHHAAPAIHGITIPDSALARAITEFVRDTETELLFNHSSRVDFFGAIAGQQRGLTSAAATSVPHCVPGKIS